MKLMKSMLLADFAMKIQDIDNEHLMSTEAIAALQLGLPKHINQLQAAIMLGIITKAYSSMTEENWLRAMTTGLAIAETGFFEEVKIQ